MGYRQTGSLEQLGAEGPWLDMEERTARRAGELLLERTRAHTPVAKPPPGHEAEWLAARKRLPGTLRDSWQVGEVEMRDAGRSVMVPVFTNDPVAPHVEWPTRPHLIVPRRPGGRLRFWTGTGETVFALVVHHPGTQGSYMLTTAIAEVSVLWQEIGAEEMRRWADEQARLVSA